MKKRYNADEAEIRALKLCSLWAENIKDTNWNPFKTVFVDGVAKVYVLVKYIVLLLLLIKFGSSIVYFYYIEQ